MVDELDRAEEMIQMERESAIDAVRARAQLQGIASGATHCRRCGAEIPGGRLRAVPAARHCTGCATEGAP
jgi:phage/conjugal plasmid C-4 type zinc finger TraR family protein